MIIFKKKKHFDTFNSLCSWQKVFKYSYSTQHKSVLWPLNYGNITAISPKCYNSQDTNFKPASANHYDVEENGLKRGRGCPGPQPPIFPGFKEGANPGIWIQPFASSSTSSFKIIAQTLTLTSMGRPAQILTCRKSKCHAIVEIPDTICKLSELYLIFYIQIIM